MKVFKLSIFFLFFNSFLFCKTVVITSIYPLKLIVKQISPPNCIVYNVIPSNVNPHIFEPTPQIIKKIEKADLFIGIQKDFDGWIEKSLNSKAKTLYLNSSNLNPHIWLSISQILKNLNNIKKALFLVMPKEKKIIEKNCEIFKEQLITLKKDLIIKFRKIENKKIIQYHPAWNYLAEDIGLTIIGTITNSERGDISLKHIIKLIKLAKKKKVKIIIASKNIKSRFLTNFSNQINGKIVFLNPLGNKEKNYLQFIKKIYQKIFTSFLMVQEKIQ